MDEKMHDYLGEQDNQQDYILSVILYYNDLLPVLISLTKNPYWPSEIPIKFLSNLFSANIDRNMDIKDLILFRLISRDIYDLFLKQKQFKIKQLFCKHLCKGLLRYGTCLCTCAKIIPDVQAQLQIYSFVFFLKVSGKKVKAGFLTLTEKIETIRE